MKRQNADNTMSGIKLNNIWYADFKKRVCLVCGNWHDSAGRTLDERGKLMNVPSCPAVSWKEKHGK